MKEFIDKYQIKELLYLENQALHSDQVAFVSKLRSLGVTVHVIERANHDSSIVDIKSLLGLIDSVVFQSTFLRWSEVQEVGLLFKSVKRPLNIFGKSIGVDNLELGLTNCFDMKDLAVMSHHKLYEVSDMYYDIGDSVVPVDLNKYKERINEVVKLKVEIIELRRLEDMDILSNELEQIKPTGRKVIIKNIKACGNQWSNIKEGSVVDELNCIHFDDNPNRGVWVMGLSEPVKLLNDSGYNEWEYENPDALALVQECLSIMLSKCNMDLLIPFIIYLNEKLSPDDERDSVHGYVNYLLETTNTEKRVNRHSIVTKIENWIKTAETKPKSYAEETQDILLSLIKLNTRNKETSIRNTNRAKQDKFIHQMFEYESKKPSYSED